VVAAIVLILIINQSISWFNRRRAAREESATATAPSPESA
jgi:hypothetical protein